MEALRYTAQTKLLNLVTIPIPQVISKTVLVKVAYAGICGTDLHMIQGEFPCEANRPITLGHEFGGIVEEVASDIVGIKKGDYVAIDCNSGCHACKFCRTGRVHFCKRGGIFNTMGAFRDGGWAQFVLVPEEQVYVLPPSIALDKVALTEPLSCLAHGWDLISPANVGIRVLIMGAGIIGNLWAVTFHLHGHRKVTVVEPNPIRLDLVKKLNTGYTLVSPDQLKKNHEADPENYLFDLVVDCSGNPGAVEYGLTLLDSGGKLCIFGVSPPHAKISMSPFDIYLKEAQIIGAFINPYTFTKSIGFIEAMGDRYLNYDNLGIRTFPLKDYPIALDCLKKGTISKAVFKLI